MAREAIKFMVQGHDSRVKTVTAGSKSSSRVYTPKDWEGKQVMIILLEPLDDDPELVER
jgi:hypothetical protein